MNEFNFDFEEADAVASEQTKENGAYVGVFTEAYGVKAQSGALGVKLVFKSEEGTSYQSTFYVKNAAGDKLFGAKQLAALQTLLKINGLKASKGEAEVWENGSKVKAEVPMYADLLDKKIGVVVQRELHERGGPNKVAYNIIRFFDAKTKLTASEVLAGVKEPKKLEGYLKNLKDKDVRTSIAASSSVEESLL